MARKVDVSSMPVARVRVENAVDSHEMRCCLEYMAAAIFVTPLQRQSDLDLFGNRRFDKIALCLTLY